MGSGEFNYMKNIDRAMYAFVGAAVLFVAYYAVVVLPRSIIYSHKLKSLKPEQVISVKLTSGDLSRNLSSGSERILNAEQKKEFLSLLSHAKRFAPNHPKGGWACLVEIQTQTDVPRYSFYLYSTTNNGVRYSLSSNQEKHDGWNYGDYRNNALGPFVEELYRPS